MKRNLVYCKVIDLPPCGHCANKVCLEFEDQRLGICDYGIAHVWIGSELHKKLDETPLRHIAENLRHELNKVLQLIVLNCVEINEQVSLSQVDLNDPASRIAGATVILDQFIEMISGVHSFSPLRDSEAQPATGQALADVIDRYFGIYSLIRNTRRARDLTLQNSVDPALRAAALPSVVEYIIAILSDNYWKYARSGSRINVKSFQVDERHVSLQFENESDEMTFPGRVFDRGYQADVTSEGFGFGLFWGKQLEGFYNRTMGDNIKPFELTHRQQQFGDGGVLQIFRIENVRVK